jgi:hypothetical protein
LRLALGVAIALGIVVPCTSMADSPAQLVVGEDSIEELLRLPGKLPAGRYEIHCKAQISDQGSVRNCRCFSMADRPVPDDLQNAVAYATSISHFVPARHDGRPVEVYATLMVIVDTRLAEPLILAVPNNGVERARYGLLYTAPQRYGDIYVGYNEVELHKPRTSVLWMEMQVDERGVIKDVKLTEDLGAPKPWAEAVHAATQRFTYLPGYNDGKPVPVRHIEPIIRRDR